MQPTASQIERVTRDYSAIANEPVTVKFINDTMYVFGSELAALRIQNKMTVGRVEFSKNLSKWFYAKEVNLFTAHTHVGSDEFLAEERVYCAGIPDKAVF